MQLRRKTFNECKGDPRMQKAVALALYLKHVFGRTSVLRNYTVNRLHEVSGVSATTLKKYMPVLLRLGLAQISGKRGQILIISKLSSHTEGRNICVDGFCFDSFKDTYNSLRAHLALAIQHRKDFIRRTIQTCHNPSSNEELRKARKNMKRLVKEGVVMGMDSVYRELGLSLRRIAEETGNCIRTAQRVMKYAVDRKWCLKRHHKEVIQVRETCCRDIEGFTYSTRHTVCRVLANTYTLDKSVSASLGMVLY